MEYFSTALTQSKETFTLNSQVGERLTENSNPKTNILNELANFIFTSKYARYNKEKNRRETWEEATNRVEEMHLKRFDFLDSKHKQKIIEAFDLIRQQYVLPSMRNMQFGGIAVETKNARSYNCSVRHIDSIDAFSEVLHLLLCGCGVGLGISKKVISNLPNLIKEKKDTRTNFILNYTVQDTIEGWADALKILLLSYHEGNLYSGRWVQFDFTKIRVKGSMLKTSGGRAPGHAGLASSLELIRQLLDRAFKARLNKLRTIDAYDILMHSADAVLSGGVRRAATSVMFDKDDEDMLNAKTGNWFEMNPQRARSNNSVTLMRGELTKEEFTAIVRRTKEFGEPGFVFVNHPETLFNPCFEVAFLPKTKNGEYGAQFCNLTTMNGNKITSPELFNKCSEAAALIGTLQAAYTNFDYLSPAAKELTEEESLLGVSITAMMDNPEILLNPIYQEEAAKIAVDTNKEWSAILGIPQAARVTVLKPEGTTTLVLGSMASGIHPAHSKTMFRRVQMNKIDPVYKLFKEKNPHLCESSIWSATGSDDVITFPIKLSDNVMVKKDINAIEHLDIIKSTQKHWVMSGTTEANTKPLNANVSCTVICKPEEWDKVIDYLYENQDFFSAVSLLADDGDMVYKQAPNQEIRTEEDQALFNFFVDNYQTVDYSELNESEDVTSLVETAACAGNSCTF